MNKVGILARLDIITFNSTSVTEAIEGTEVPFALNYKLETNDKSGHFLSSSAEINIYETTNFNIDNLKTSSETDIKVEYSIGGILKWAGFVVPDFFSREVGSPGIVNMTASDRLSTLKGVTLTGLSTYTTLRSLAEQCLLKTGLSLYLDTYVGITEQAGSGTNVMNTKVLSQRVNDNKGRSISCYDILKSILILTNAVLVQRNSRWAIVNKTELYNGTALPAEQYINFSDVLKGARREIIPVASSVGVYQEFGGSKMSPDNYDFSGDLTGWTANGGFVGTINNKEITGYSQTYTPVYGVTADKKYLVNSNNFLTTRYLESTPANIPYSLGEINIIVYLNTIGPRVQTGLGQAKLRVAVGAYKSGSPTIWLNDNESFTSATPFIHEFLFPEGSALSLPAVTMDVRLSGKIVNPEGYQVVIRVYGSNVGTNGDVTRVTTLNFAELTFEKKEKTSKGIIYKTEQGSSFTKKHDIATSIFGDYIQKGLNGYFYNYSVDDTSSLLLPDGTLTSSWNTASDTNVLPILQHVTRQISREFSIAHDIVSCEFQCLDFDPLATFRDCNLKRYTLVSSSFDYLRGMLRAQIEETTINGSITKKDYIYSYFGEGEKGITSVGGVSSTGTSSSGGAGGIETEVDPIYNSEKLSFALKTEIPSVPTRVSQLTNDSGYLTSVPAETDPIYTSEKATLAPINSPKFTGTASVTNNTSYTTKQLRNIIISTADADPAQMGAGDIWIKYV